MIEIEKQPPSIHTVHGPVVFEFTNVIKNQLYSDVVLEVGGEELKIPLEFFEQYAKVDLRRYLHPFFKPLKGVSQGVVCDEYQSFNYRIRLSEKRSSEEFTAVRAIPQLGEDNDWNQRTNCLLTGLHQLKVYEGYPCDLSVLAAGKRGWVASAGTWRSEPLKPARINRLALNCNDAAPWGCCDGVAEVESYWSSSLEWTDFVCRQVDGRTTSDGLGCTLLYRNLKNYKEVYLKEYKLLDAFDAFVALSEDAYTQLTPEQVQERAGVLISRVKLMEECTDLARINEVINSNFNLCTGKEADEMIGQVIDYAGIFGGWEVKEAGKPQNWLLCDGTEYTVEAYEELYKAILNTYGGNAEKTGKFNVPNLGGRFVMGYEKADVKTGVSEEPQKGSHVDLKQNQGKIGNYGGEWCHKLLVKEMPKHMHEPGTGVHQGNRVVDNSNGKARTHYGSEKVSGHPIPDLHFTTEVGNDQPHENRPPYMVFAKLIRAK